MHTKKIPIILRKKNDRNDQFNTSSAVLRSFSNFNTENISFPTGLSTSPNADLEKETNRLLHHKRKQLHSPLDKRCDTHDSNNNNNNNRNKKARVNHRTNDSADCAEKSASRKRRSGKSKKHSSAKKPKQATIYKTGGGKTASRKSSSRFDTVINISPNIFAADFFNVPVCQSSPKSNTSRCENETSEIGWTMFDNFNSSHDNESSGSLQKQCYDVYSNPVVSEESTRKSDATKLMLEKDFANFGLMKSIDNNNNNNNNGMNILFDPELLHPCACASCTSCNEDNTFDSSVSTINDTEMEHFTSCICSDFIMDDYDRVLGEAWLQEFVERDLCCENICKEIKEIAKDNDGDGLTTNAIEKNANDPIIVEQSNLQPYSAGVTYANGLTNCLKSTEDINVFDEEKSISQNEIFAQTTVLADASNDMYQPQDNKEDLCLIQCPDCRKIFNGKNQFKKHVTRCTILHEESFECTICLKRYKHKSSLAQHLKIVHNVMYNNNEKSYVCAKCSKSYVRFRAFQRHEILHESKRVWVTGVH